MNEIPAPVNSPVEAAVVVAMVVSAIACWQGRESIKTHVKKRRVWMRWVRFKLFHADIKAVSHCMLFFGGVAILSHYRTLEQLYEMLRIASMIWMVVAGGLLALASWVQRSKP